jgi:hypothetical protein
MSESQSLNVHNLQQGLPSSGSAFALTIKPWVREADMNLTTSRGCARFGLDDGYMVGPKEVVFKVLADFAKGIKEGSGCELVARSAGCTTWTRGRRGMNAMRKD